jgi:hypothetical protein
LTSGGSEEEVLSEHRGDSFGFSGPAKLAGFWDKSFELPDLEAVE